ncbi:MAG: methionine--tRNA ligase [Planctomycetota bacterium]
MATRRYLVTGALPYSNGRLHVGHIAGAYLPADIFVRYHRARGDEAAFICGSDDNGVPITLTARKEGKTPAEVSKFYHDCQVRDFEGLGIHFDIYGATTLPLHAEISQHFFLACLENGYLAKKETEQLYDREAGMFLPDRYVKGRCPFCGHTEAYGDQCEGCGKTMNPKELLEPKSVVSGSTPEIRRTVHWFFQLERFNKRLRDWHETHPEWRPMVRNFTGGLLRQGLPERAITRDLDWGIPVPVDDEDAKGKVLYVWFDAPIGYVSFTAQWCQDQGGDRRDYEKWWKDPATKIVHFIGEDNVVFHAIMWPAMLLAEGTFELPENIIANCFLNMRVGGKEEEKISKSRGTAIWIEEYLKELEPDALRYYLTAIAPESQRTAFSLEDYVSRTNDELVAALGNFVHRTTTFTRRYFEGRVPEAHERSEAERAQLATLAELHRTVTEKLEANSFRDALAEIMAAARTCNRYFDTKAPWQQRKQDIAACGTTINVCLQSVRTLATVFAPFLPFAAEKARAMFDLSAEDFAWDRACEELAAGRPIGEPQMLFRKLDSAAALGPQG